MQDETGSDSTDDASQAHVPVMCDRITELLVPDHSADGWVVDCTLGLGGHTAALLAAAPEVRVLGIDRDPQALALAVARLAPFEDRFLPAQGVFDTADEILTAAAVEPNAYLFDLGVSSLQLDSDERGFAYSRDTPLDMRMDPASPLTAADIVNKYSAEELAYVFSHYGEERHSRRIAAAIVRSRAAQPLTTSVQLGDVVAAAIPAARRRTGHPAKRVFQALRIEVNDELGALQRALAAAIHRLQVGGRIVVMSYHSLEDRITKRTFASGLRSSAPPGLPVVPVEHQPFLRAVTRGAEMADDVEARSNPRSRSVRVRCVEKIAAVPSHWRAVT